MELNDQSLHCLQCSGPAHGQTSVYCFTLWNPADRNPNEISSAWVPIVYTTRVKLWMLEILD
jgi:hypothetical protein